MKNHKIGLGADFWLKHRWQERREGIQTLSGVGEPFFPLPTVSMRTRLTYLSGPRTRKRHAGGGQRLNTPKRRLNDNGYRVGPSWNTIGKRRGALQALPRGYRGRCITIPVADMMGEPERPKGYLVRCLVSIVLSRPKCSRSESTVKR